MKTRQLHQFIQKHHYALVELIAFVFVLLFVFAAVTKLLEGDRFFNNLNNSPILPDKAVPVILSWAIPILEIIVAILIVGRKTRLKGFYSVLILSILFALYTSGIVFFSPYTPCSCGGIITLLSWPQHLMLNIGLILLVITGIRLYKKRNLFDTHTVLTS